MRIIKYKKVNDGKYEITLDSSEKIKLYEDVILKEELLLKKEITDLDSILEINKQYEIYHYALNYLNHHVISTKELKDYLLRKKYDIEKINEVIKELLKNGYLNDEYYAKCYINNQINLSNDGPLKIINHLKQNGIDSAIYLKNLDMNDTLWREKITKYIDKQLKGNKKSTYYFKNKVLINLINLGYEKDMIESELNKVSINNLEELKEIEKEKIRKKLARKYTGDELERKIKEKLYQKGFFE